MSAEIVVSNLTKRYKIYFGPRALLKEIIFRKPTHHSVLALENLSFSVQRGESFGVVGDNGAGKSTLLKLLTGTAFPTSGHLEVNGSVSALLELGAGFHPDFTGRENIYFNGALMGFVPDQVREREADIIGFSELEDVIDRPVKTYSSGMYVRLGFAVATGFDPSILIIDEALAVGDQRFQKKCTDRILDFRRRGRTILFCSHNLYQVRKLCDRALWLRSGRQQSLGPAEEVIRSYTDFLREEQASDLSRKTQRSRTCWIEQVTLHAPDPSTPRKFNVGDTICLEVRAHFGPDFQGVPGIAVGIVRNDGLVVHTVSTTMENQPLKQIGANRYACRIIYPDIQLLSGSYYFNVGATDEDNIQGYDVVEKAEPFVVTSRDADYGVVRLSHRWENDGE